MTKKSNSFTYSSNGLSPNLSYLDVYSKLIDRYQQERLEEKKITASYDDRQLMRERYSDTPSFISHIQPFNATSLLFVNRRNGYLAYTDKIPSTPLSPIAGIDFLSVDSFFEYLSRVKDTQYAGFFYCAGQLSCYATVDDDVFVSLAIGDVPLLFFAESFEYVENIDPKTGRSGIATLHSPYYPDITLEVYTKDALGYLDKYIVYSQTSTADPHPESKIPGEPIYKALHISQFDTSITKINIDGTIIDFTDDLNRVFVVEDDRFMKGYLGLRYTGEGIIEMGFSLPFKDDPLVETVLTVSLYREGEWSEPTDCKLYFQNNFIHSLTTSITIDPQDLYLDVPTQYTLRIAPRFFFTQTERDTTTDLIYLNKKISTPLYYKAIENNNSVYQTDYITVPQEEGKKPDEYLFKIEDNYSEVNGFIIPVWLYGYTTNEINRIPDDFIIINPDVKSEMKYTEYERAEYIIDFVYRGTISLKEVGIERIFDDYGYFTTEDFTIEKLSETEDTLTYKLILDKKIFPIPIDSNAIPFKVLFSYKVMRKNLSEFYWPADTLTLTMDITYILNRFEIRDAEVDNKLTGDATIRYRIFDTILNKYTDKYSDDERLVLKGSMIFSDNIKKRDDIMGWDIRNKIYSSRVNITEYGDISLQYKGIQSVSNTALIEHNEPIHPLQATPHIRDTYKNVLCRIVVDLSYNDMITAIYNDGNLVSLGTPIAIENVKNGYGSLFPIYTADKKEILGIGVDFVPTEVGSVNVNMKINWVNEYDYSNWPKYIDFTVPVKPQEDIINFTFTLTDFKFGKLSSGIIKLNDLKLEDAKIVATVKNASNEVIVAKPNFNPIGEGDFTTINLYIDEYLSEQKQYYLDFEISEYENASKDNDYPNRFYYIVRIPFEVSEWK